MDVRLEILHGNKFVARPGDHVDEDKIMSSAHTLYIETVISGRLFVRGILSVFADVVAFKGQDDEIGTAVVFVF